MKNHKPLAGIFQNAPLQTLFVLVFMLLLNIGMVNVTHAAIRTWKGAGVISGTGSTDINRASNWSGGAALSTADDLVFTIKNGSSFTIALSANLNVNSISVLIDVNLGLQSKSLTLNLGSFNLTTAGAFSVTNSAAAGINRGSYYINIIVPALKTLSIGGDLTCSVANTSYVENFISFENSGSVIVNGTTTANALNAGTASQILFTVGDSPANYTFNGNVLFDDGISTSGSLIGIGSMIAGNTGSFKFNGDLSLGACAFTNVAFTAGTVIFDKAGSQTLTYDNRAMYFWIPNLSVGSLNNPAVTLAGCITPDNIRGNFTINGSAIVNLNTGQWNRHANGGTFTMNGTSKLQISGSSSVLNNGTASLIPGSNFPSGFSTISLAPATTIEYNGGDTVNQTIYAPVTYGNLILSNASGSGATIKSLTSNLAGVAGNLTVNSFTTFDQSTFTANRSSTGGVFTMNADAILKLSGNSGGQTGSNFPLNFSSILLNAASTTEYNSLSGSSQTVHAPVTYGNLVLTNGSGSGNSTKNLAANLTGIAGNLTINSYVTFDQSAFTANRSLGGGVFTLAANAIHKLSGASGGQTGSNFPLNFSSVSLNAASTTEYNSANGVNQTLYGPVTYGDLILTNSTGSGNSNKILTANITGIAGNLLINPFTSFDQSTFTANRASAGGTFSLAANTLHKVGGGGGGQTGSNFPLNFTTVTLDPVSITEYNSLSGVSQTVHAPIAYGNLILTNGTGSGSSIKLLAADMLGIAGNFTINSFTTFDQVTYKANRTAAGGAFTLNANAIHKLAGISGGQPGSNFPLNFSTISMNSLSSTEYNGASGGTQTIHAPLTYGNLILSNGSGSGNANKILTANITGVSGNLTINPFATFDQSTFTANRSSAGGAFTMNANAILKLSGNSGGQTGSNFPLNFSSIVLNAASTTEYNSISGSSQTVHAPVTYGNLVLTNGTGSGNSVKNLAANLTGIAGSLTVNSYATFDQSAFTANRSLGGGVFTLAANAIHKLSGASGGQTGSNFPLNFASIVLNAASTTEYNSLSGSSQTVHAPVTYGNLVLTNGTGSGNSTKNLAANLTGIAGNLTVNSYVTFDQSAFTANRSLGGGVFTLAANTFHKLSGASGGQTGSNFPLNFSTVSLNASSTTEYNSAYGVNQTLYGPVTYGNLILTNSTGSGNSNKILTANITGIAGNMVVNPFTSFDQSTFTANRASAGGTFSLAANSLHRVGGGAGGQTGSNFPLNFAMVTLNVASTTDYNSLSGVNQTIYSPVTYGNLVLTNSTGAGNSNKTLAANITGIAGNLTVNSFTTFDQVTYKANRSSAGGVFTLNANAIHKLGGNLGGQPGSNFPLSFSTISMNSLSSTEYNAASGVTQTIHASVTYGNLVLSNSSGSGNANKILTGNITGLSGNLTINPFATFDQSTFTANRSSAGGVLTMNANAILKLSGNSGGQTGSNFPLNFSSIVLNAASTTEYNSLSGIAQTVYAPVAYGNLVLTNSTGSGSSLKILAGDILGIAANLTINSFATFDQSTYKANRSSAGGVLTVNANAVHKISGNAGGQTGSNYPLNFTSVLLNSASTTEYNSANGVNQTIYSPVTYGNLVLTNATGSGNNNKVVVANINGIAGDLTVNSNLVFDASSYTFNRSAPGGTLRLSAQASMRLGGSTGGQPGSNFPLNFSILNLDPASTVEYNGITQAIYGGVNYGHLALAGTGAKTAPGSLSIKGNLSKTTSTVFLHNSGQVNFNGTNAQLYSAVDPVMQFYTVLNSNSTGLNIQSDMGIVNQLSLVTNSKLNLSDTGSISLKSTSAATAAVGVIPTGASINYLSSGRFIVERYINSGVAHGKGWQLIGAPVQTEALYTIKKTWLENGAVVPGAGTWLTSPLYAAGNFDAYSPSPSLKVYNGTTNAYDGVSSTSAPLNNKNGYFVYVRGDRLATPVSGIINSTTLRSKGKLYDLVTPAPSVSVPSTGYATAANPYPSAIDLRQLRTQSTNLTGDIYIWDPTLAGSYGAGGYRTIAYSAPDYHITPVGGIYPTSVMNEIQSGQAFFVKANGVGTGLVQFSEAVKVGGSHLVTRMSSGPAMILNASLSTTASGTTTLLDGAMAIFDDAFSNSADMDDAVKFSNSNNNVSFKRDSKLFAVERRTQPTSADTLHLNLSGIAARSYLWEISCENFTDGQRLAWLWDKFLNIKTPLDLASNTAVTFDVTSNPLSAAADRFKIIFSKTAATLPVTFVSVKATRKADHTVAVEWKVENEINIAHYEVDRSEDGNRFTKILETPVAGGSITTHNYSQVDLSALPSAHYYRIRAVNNDGLIDYSNTVKVAAENVTASISIYPNPVVDHILHLHFKSMPKGQYTIQLTTNLGQSIYSGNAEVTSSLADKNIKVSENIAAGAYQLIVTDVNGNNFNQQVVLQ